MSIEKVAGVILAGGRGDRLGGVIKAHLEIGGVKLVDRVLGALTPQADPVLLSIGRFGQGALEPSRKLIEVADGDGLDIGPVAGLAAAADWCQRHTPDTEFLLSAAVDTPFFPQHFADMALPLLNDSATDVVMGAEHGQPYPTNALWRLSGLASLSAKIADGSATGGLRALLPASRISILDIDHAGLSGSFVNINTPEDLERCTRLAETLDAEPSAN